MKVLVSAIACLPNRGSEQYIGWAALNCLAHDHDVWVLAGRRNQPEMERVIQEGLVPPNVKIVFAGRFQPWHRVHFVAQMQSWREYISFLDESLAVARDLHRTVRFDLAHHVTFATWRIGSPLWKLGIPYVHGPVGGGAAVPFRMMSILSPRAMVYETMRTVSNTMSAVSPRVRACVRHAAHVLASDAETQRILERIRGSTEGVSGLLHAFFSDERIRQFSCGPGLRQMQGPLRLFGGGYMVGTKGMMLSLHALARAKAQGMAFRYLVAGMGPEVPHLKKLAGELGLEKEVVFENFLRGQAYADELAASHAFLMPSLRESAGLTMMESMLAGCVPVVADCSGPARIVTDECGFKIPITSPNRMIEALAQTVLALDRNRQMMAKKGAAAVERIVTTFSEQRYRKEIHAIYARLTTPACSAERGRRDEKDCACD